MKSLLKSPKKLLGCILGIILLGGILGAGASDLTTVSTYSTNIPQTGDTDAIIAHRAALSQGQLSNGNKYGNITTATTTLLKTGAGVLERINVNTAGSSSVITIYDNTAGSGTKIGTASGNAQAGLSYNARFSTGLTIVTTGTPGDITVSYR